ncbi:hypothetical protein Acr_12g0005690 [Actinidia rufa]|uniref:Uncharacterized protein n=1 Tax=Actinidia rufa TaxID=165716 RepID=A0A7J0FH50_9ERIC|nr:hypothetical protein Acr_12g0005690 [Actinidia rufa]
MGSGLFIDGVMGHDHGPWRDPRKDKYGKIGDVGDIIGEIAIWRIGFWRDLVEILSTLPRPRARRGQYPGSWRADEHSDGGSGELSGDDLAKFHGLVLPRSRGFGDKPSLKGRPIPRWCQGVVPALVEDFIPHHITLYSSRAVWLADMGGG